MQKEATVVGAGLVGSLWSILLAQRDYRVKLYDRRSDMRKAGFLGGRSINLAMSNRGWKAIEKAGIVDAVKATALPMKGRMMHSVSGDLTFQPYGKEGEAIYSVSRGGLNLELLHQASKYDSVSFHFDERCMGIEQGSLNAKFEHTETGLQHESDSPLIFGTDGAFSAVRGSLQRTPMFNYSQQYLPHGYKELSILPDADGNHLLEKEYLHIWPRGHFMLIALPNYDGSFTCTLFLPFKGKEAFENLNTDKEIMDFFERFFPDTIPLMPNLVEEFKTNPSASLVTVRCNPWTYKSKVLLMGDASHAIVPFYGQGMNSGFEDCSIISELMDSKGDDWASIFEEVNQSRIKDADAIADLALRNFIEMRDQVGDPKFLLRKKIAGWLHEKHPDTFIPMYSMVTFSHIPYHIALAESKAQDQLFEKILSIEGIENNYANAQTEAIFLQWLEEKKM